MGGSALSVSHPSHVLIRRACDKRCQAQCAHDLYRPYWSGCSGVTHYTPFSITQSFDVNILQVAKKSTDLRPFVEQYEQRMAEVTTFIEQHKNLPGNVEKEEESSSDDEDEVLLCESCSPLEATG